MADPKSFVEGDQCLVDELSAVIGHNRMGNAKPANYTLPYKLLHLANGDGLQGLDFNPLRKIVHPHQKESALTFSWRKGSYNIHSPHGKGLWRGDTMQRL